MKVAFHTYQERDFSFCNSLLEENMHAYFLDHGVVWDSKRYAREIEKGILRVLYVAEEKVGFIHLSEKGAYGYINSIQISSPFRKLGIGKQALDWIDAFFEQKGKKAVQLSIYQNNPALKLYLRQGYTIQEAKGAKYLMQKSCKREY